MLRAKIDRIGLGGYLHLLEDYPDFVEYISRTADEFRVIKALHEEGEPQLLRLHVGVLTAWGKHAPGHFPAISMRPGRMI